MQIQLSATRNSPLGDARRTLVRAFSLVGLFSIGVSLLLLAGPLYMLQIYDRVIPTGHVDTLLVLSAILVGAFAVLAALDALRALVAQRLGLWLERRLSGPVLAASAQAALLRPGISAQGLRDVATLRSYLGSPAIFPLFDAPMAPFFLAILFLIHPLLGAVALVGGAVLFALALLNEWLTRRACWPRRIRSWCCATAGWRPMTTARRSSVSSRQDRPSRPSRLSRSYSLRSRRCVGWPRSWRLRWPANEDLAPRSARAKSRNPAKGV